MAKTASYFGMGLCIVVLGGCGVSRPGCGDDDTVAAVVEVAKVPTRFKLLDEVREAVRDDRFEKCTADANGRLREQLSILFDAAGKTWDPGSVTVHSDRTLCGVLPEEEKCYRLFLLASNDDDWRCRMNVIEEVGNTFDYWSAEYSLDTIRFKGLDEKTGTVSCAARLHAAIPTFGKTRRDITYTVERTTDGKPFVTVGGLD